MDFSRRSFLRAMAVSATMAATGCTPKATVSTTEAPIEVDAWKKATCRFCGTGCGVMVGVKNGKVVATKGDTEAPVNKGLNCVKGYFLSKIMYGPDRLKKPLIRKNGKLVESSWEEALDLVTSKMKEAIAKSPDRVAMFASGQMYVWEGYAAAKLYKACIGTNNIDPNARFCMASAVAGFMTTFGIDEPMNNYEDIEQADVFVTWGSNMAEMHPILFARMTNRKLSAPETKFFDLTTRKSRTSELADEVLVFTPHSDLAIANAIANYLIQNNMVNTDFVNKYTVFKKGLENIGYGINDKENFIDKPENVDFEFYKQYVSKYTLEYAEKLSNVPAAKIEALAKLYGDPKKKVMSFWTMGMNQHVRGTWINNLLYNIHLLAGKISLPGCGPFSLTGQPSACGTAREVGTFAHRLPADMVVTNPEHRKIAAEIWKVPVEKISPKVGWHAVEMFRAVDRGELDVVWVMTNNVLQAIPNLNRYRKAFESGKCFLVVSDAYPNRTTELASVVLPSAMWVEKEGMFGNAERRSQHLAKCVEPPGEARSDLWQIIEIAKRLGYGDKFPGNGPKDHPEKELWEEYRKFGTGKAHDLAPYEVYVKVRGLKWPVVEKDGKWVETTHRFRKGTDPYVKENEFEFYGNKAQGNKANIWCRPYEPPAESPDAEYPFWFQTGRVLEHWHSGTMTMRVPELKRAVPNAYVEFHPDDAAKMNIKIGDMVKVISRRGEFTAPAMIGGRGEPQKGMVYAPWFDENILVNFATFDAHCPISKQPDYKKCAVKVVKL